MPEKFRICTTEEEKKIGIYVPPREELAQNWTVCEIPTLDLERLEDTI